MNFSRCWAKVFLLVIYLLPVYAGPWILNNPYPEREDNEKIYYSSFSEQPKTLDPARAYSSNEYQFVMQIYEPPLEYDYLARPYRLVPLSAASMPTVRFLDKQNREISAVQVKDIAYSAYTIRIKSGILYQPHPALAKDKTGHYRYLNIPSGFVTHHNINKLSDFKFTGSREMTADDYIYQIKRLARPSVNSPIYGLMSEHIVGFKAYARSLPSVNTATDYIDLRKYPLAGVKKIDKYSFEILVYKQYPQFIFWLAMPFFAPVPWEADRFYSQPGMDDKNLSFEWYPIGTGPFMLAKNNPNRHIILVKNPNFRPDYFPAQGSKEDMEAGYLQHAGKRMPLIDKAIFTLEKETIPRWNKFLQGYYDTSYVTADSFDQAIYINGYGAPLLSKSMQEKKMRLSRTIDASVYYLGFNMMDLVVGGNSERARKLRQAISLAVNYDENIAIFLNGRGFAAQGPIPPGIFGFKEGAAGVNPYVYSWDGSKAARKSLKEARQLMREAGYPKGIDQQTGKPLMLHYDVSITTGPDDKARLDWMRKQFAHIGIDLNVRATQYNRFQDKMRSGNAQIYSWGWTADYPDPENFLFMFVSKNGKAIYGGENASNYSNPHYDQLFELMKNRPNDKERQRLIDEMVEILRHDAPWVWGINSESLLLLQQWISPLKPNSIDFNTLKYVAVDSSTRNGLRVLWNKPVLWPIGVLLLFIIFCLLPLFLVYSKKERQSAERYKL